MRRYLVHLIHVYLILTMLTPFPVWAAVGTSASNTFYVVKGCANNGDGLASNCAASGGASGAWNALASVVWTTTTGVDDRDILNICGEFIDETLVLSASATLGNEIQVRGDGCAGNPGIINRIHTMTEATTAGNWTNESENIWYLDVSGYSWPHARRVWLNDIELMVADQKTNLGTQINGGTPVSTWFPDTTNNRLYLYSVGNPATGMTSLKSLVAGSGTCSYSAVCANGASVQGIKLTNLTIKGGNLAGFYTLGSQRIELIGTAEDASSCNVLDGVRGVIFQGTSTSGTGSNSVDLKVDRCTIDQRWPSNLADYRFEPSILGSLNAIEISGSTRPVVRRSIIRDSHHANIYMIATTGTDTVVDGIIEENLVTCRDYVAYCRLFNADGATVGRLTNNTIRRNRFLNASIRSQVNGNGNFYLANLWGLMRDDVVVKGGTSHDKDQTISVEKYAGVSQDNLFASNVFYGNPWGACVDYRNSGLSSTGNQFIDNIFDGCSVAISIPSSFTGDLTVRGNLFNPASPNPITFNGTSYTVSGFEAVSSGSNVFNSNKTGDPLFLGYPDNLRPGTSSPARTGGVTYAQCTDFVGRVCLTVPTIGAYQMASPDGASVRIP